MHFLDLVFPPKCISCGEVLDCAEKYPRTKGADALCRTCRGEFESEKLRRCVNCGEQMIDCSCMLPALYKSNCLALLKLCKYRKAEQKALKSLVFCLKREHDGRCERFLATQLSYVVSSYVSDKSVSGWILTNVPRGRGAKLRYGYDHAQNLAKRVADLCGLEYNDVFRRTKKRKEQKYLGYSERLDNAKGTFALRESADVRGKNFIVIDDVVTSGSSMSECVKALYDGGAEYVAGACIAVTEKKRPVR